MYHRTSLPFPSYPVCLRTIGPSPQTQTPKRQPGHPLVPLPLLPVPIASFTVTVTVPVGCWAGCWLRAFLGGWTLGALRTGHCLACFGKYYSTISLSGFCIDRQSWGKEGRGWWGAGQPRDQLNPPARTHAPTNSRRLGGTEWE